MSYLLLLTGFILLILSGKYLLKGSVSLAASFKISKLVMGMTVVAFGTSAPELFVSVIAATNGHPEISIGNVVGSNIANIALILGITAIIFPIPVHKNAVKVDWPVMMAATLLFFVFILNGQLGTIEGFIFLILLFLYIFFSIYLSRKNGIPDETEMPSFNLVKSISLTLLSSIGLAAGSSLLVDNASAIAIEFGIEERVISITLIAIGTSLPELTTSLIAAIRKETDISIGNIIGSNIFNIFAILGITSIIKNIEIPKLTIAFDVYWMIGVAILLFLFFLPSARSKITRFEGLLFILIYFVYIYLLF